MSELIKKSHNVSILLYHYVCPAKYRRIIFDEKVERVLVWTCIEISKRHDINYIEIGCDDDHVHFLIQSVPMLSPTEIVRITKSITAREIFKKCPWVKKKLWGGNLWSSGFFVGTVGKHGNEEQIKKYVKAQGQKYKELHKGQLTLFD